MTRKPDIKPLLATKHDFVASLDNVMQRSIALIQAIEYAVKLKVNFSDPDSDAAKMVRAQIAQFRASIFTND